MTWRPLKEEVAKALPEKAACFVWLNLTTGMLEIRATDDDFAVSSPWLVAVCWMLRWPVAPLPADRANKLMDEIAPHAQHLIEATSTELPDRERPGTVLYYGAGPALDAIQRCCAATWTDPDRLHTETQ
ncbi:hypothetical protein AB0I86_32725 [Streptomyces sp. NPDC049950]|uniref:hypothetical protein n=1 Tax=Streptomyces sp. NPDC049950 TaxID=3156659 RepID=UPI00343ABDD2